MAVKASTSITISYLIDVKAVYRYYKQVANGSSAPSVPTTANANGSAPSGWSLAEPTVDISKTLYFVDLTIYSNANASGQLASGSYVYSAVSKSSSYEASKQAYNTASQAQSTANSASQTAQSAQSTAQSAQSTANTANSKIDGLQIGGRNLVRNSSQIRTLAPRNTGEVGDNYNYTAWQLVDNVKAGTYTVSGEVEFTHGTDTVISCYFYNADNPNNGQILPASIVNGKFQLTFQKLGDTTTQILTYAGRAGATRGKGCIFKNIKVEIGNKATDWTPAPEDIDESIEAVSNDLDLAEQAIGGINTSIEELSNNATEIVNNINRSLVSLNSGVESLQAESDSRKNYLRILNDIITLGHENGWKTIVADDGIRLVSESGQTVGAFKLIDDNTKSAMVADAISMSNVFLRDSNNEGSLSLVYRSNKHWSLKEG